MIGAISGRHAYLLASDIPISDNIFMNAIAVK